MGFSGAKALTDALNPAPCGCELLLKADATPDPRGAAVLRDRGQELREAWGCPGEAPRTEAQTKALAAVSRLVGEDLTGCAGCPMRLVAHPDVHRAVRLHRWWVKGELAMRGPLSAAELDAIDAVEDGRLRREVHELEEERARREREKRGRRV